MPIYHLLQSHAFEPAQVEVMTQAFETVCLELKLAQRIDPLRDVVARTIIECAQRGERDPERLVQTVLAEIHGYAEKDRRNVG